MTEQDIEDDKIQSTVIFYKKNIFPNFYADYVYKDLKLLNSNNNWQNSLSYLIFTAACSCDNLPVFITFHRQICDGVYYTPEITVYMWCAFF